MRDRHTLMTGLKTYLIIPLKLSLLFAPRRTECLDRQTDSLLHVASGKAGGVVGEINISKPEK